MPQSHELAPTNVLPITPDEAHEAKVEQLPNEVIEVFNALIAEKIHKGYAKVMQKDVVEKLESLGFKREDIFEKHMLDIEDMYRAAGWNVTYDSPGFNENYYEESFKFRAKQP